MTTERQARMLRYEVPVDDQWHTFDVPAMTRIQHLVSRRPEVVEFWAELWEPLDGEEPLTTPRTFRVYGTGQPYDPRNLDYKGTALAAGGQLVWHLFEQVKP
ncbi:MAG TPA: hypothetical protein VI172_01830 [Candidatus Dormibacteraeota bacterium]|jgi:hypothetical protein